MPRPAAAVRQFDSALAHHRAGDLRKAEAGYKQVLKRDPNHPDALRLLATLMRRVGKHDRAAQLLARAVKVAPASVDLRTDLGNALKTLQQFDEAIGHLEQAARLSGRSPETLSNLALAHKAAGDPETAIIVLQDAAQRPDAPPEILYNLGNAQIAAGDSEAAADTYREVLKVTPDHFGATMNLGIALRDQGRLENATTRLQRAVELAPADPDARWNLGLAQLMGFDWGDGWANYEARRDIPGFAIRSIAGAPWDGSDLTDQRLLVHAEQGLGDALQFLRYLPAAAQQAQSVAFAVPGRMVGLLEDVLSNVAIVDVDADLPEFDIHAPLLSLPHLLDQGDPTSLSPITPPLSAQPDRVRSWQHRLPDASRKIGIAWQGNPSYGADRRRSIPLAMFEPLSRLSDAALVSLQQIHGLDQLDAGGWREGIVRFADTEIDVDGAFLDTAAIMASLDLVVTSDTAIAHLAGVMGIPVWVALARVPDWRWGLVRENSPWHPNMRLFRQETDGDWKPVFARIADELSEA